jgi:hypothetical protein
MSFSADCFCNFVVKGKRGLNYFPLISPLTTGTFTRTTSQGKVYYAITLSANEPATSHFRLTGQAHITAGGADSTTWQVYTGPISVAVNKKGTASFDYYPVDSVGNTEATRTEVLQ